MSSRVGFWLAALLLLLAAGLRLWKLPTLPAGLHPQEVTDIRIVETVRQGGIEVFYNLGGEGRESLYHVLVAAITGFIGSGLVGFHIISVWASLLALALVYALAARLYGPLAGVAALALLAVNLSFNLMSREIGREVLLPPLLTAILLMLARVLAVYRSRLSLTPTFAALGVLLGLGFYAHPTHFMIALASMVFIAFMLISRRPLTRRTFSYLSFSLLLTIIFATPYVISHLRLPELGGASRLLSSYTLVANPPLQAIWESFNGIFFLGDSDPVRNLPGRPLLDLVSGLVLLVGVLTAARHWRQPRYALALIAALFILPVAFLQVASPNFQAFAALLPLLALFFGLGVTTLYRSLARPVRPVAAVGLLALLLFNLNWLSHDLFEIWPRLPQVAAAYSGRIGQLAHYLDLTAGAIPTVICESSRPGDTAVTGISQTDLLLLMMNRKGAPLRFADCGSGLVLANGGAGQQIAFPEADGLENMHPYLRDWALRGEILGELTVPANAIIRLSVERELADTIGRFTTTAPVGYAPEAPGVGTVVAPPVRFGGNITFLGYEPENSVLYPPGGIVRLITYWRADGVIPPDLRLFTHVLSSPEDIAAQSDTISVDVSRLQPRDVFIQITFVPLPNPLAHGVYNLSIGAYRATNSLRMGVLQDDQQRGTRLFLGQIFVR